MADNPVSLPGNKNVLFTNRQLVTLMWPLLLEQMLAIAVGLADSLMVATVGDAAISAVSLVDSISNLMIYIFSAMATGGAAVAGQYIGLKQKEDACNAGQQLIALLAVVMTLMMAPGHLLLQILQCLVIVQSISLACALVCLYATLMSLSSPLQAGVDFTLFQCTDAAIAILAGVIGGVVAQHFGYAACFLFAGAFTLLAAWVAYIRLHSARELMTSAID